MGVGLSTSTRSVARWPGGRGARRRRAWTRPALGRVSGLIGGSRTAVGWIARPGPRDPVDLQRGHCNVLRIRPPQEADGHDPISLVLIRHADWPDPFVTLRRIGTLGCTAGVPWLLADTRRLHNGI